MAWRRVEINWFITVVGVHVGQAAGGSVLHPVNGYGHPQDVTIKLEGFVQVADANGDVRNAGRIHRHDRAS